MVEVNGGDWQRRAGMSIVSVESGGIWIRVLAGCCMILVVAGAAGSHGPEAANISTVPVLGWWLDGRGRVVIVRGK